MFTEVEEGDVEEHDVNTLMATAAAVPNPPDVPRGDPDPVHPAQAASISKAARLISLDAFRGLTILLMLLVNNAAVDTATPAQLTHAPWNGGIHLADLVFPWFLFCVGVAIPYSVASARAKGLSSWRCTLKIAQRTLVLVFLGCLIDSSEMKTPVFSMDVLQLIGMAYFVGALCYFLPRRARAAFAGMLLIAYWAAIKFLPVPGMGSGAFTESQNLIVYLDRLWLTRYHLDGLTSVVPTAALVMIGTVFGDSLRLERKTSQWRIAHLLTWGLILLVLGWVWNLSLPFNKPVWTPSYILFSAGSAALTFALLYWATEARGWAKWFFPLIVFGSNAIAAYVIPILAKTLILQQWTAPGSGGKPESLQDWWLHGFVAHLGRIPGGWAYTASYILIWWLMLWQLYRRRVFLRV